MRRNVIDSRGRVCQGVHILLIPALLMLFMPVATGCRNQAETGAAVGGAGGAASGAAVGAASGAPVAGVGALIGGAAGAVAGGVIGASKDKNSQRYRDEAMRISDAADRNPALASAVNTAPTADLNGDGWTTMDEIVALQKAGLSERQMIDRIRKTQQVFYVGEQQREYLKQQGVDDKVIEFLNDSAQMARHSSGGASNAGASTRPTDMQPAR
jgi:hypothetical protein